MVQVVIFATFVVGDLVAIPFRYMFAGYVRPVAVDGEQSLHDVR